MKGIVSVSGTVCPNERPRGLTVGLCSWRNKANHPELITVHHGLGDNGSLIFYVRSAWLILLSITSTFCLFTNKGKVASRNNQMGTWDWRGLFTCCDVLCLCRKEKLMPWAWMEATSTAGKCGLVPVLAENYGKWEGQWFISSVKNNLRQETKSQLIQPQGA